MINARIEMKAKLGFTLIELLVALGVLAVLMLLAVPSIRERNQKVNLDTAAQIMLKDSQFMEKWYGLNGRYTSDSAGTTFPSLPYVIAPESGVALYYISLKSGSMDSGNGYILLGQPLCGTVQASLGCICIDQDANVIKGTNNSCNNSGGLCSCINSSSLSAAIQARIAAQQ